MGLLRIILQRFQPRSLVARVLAMVLGRGLGVVFAVGPPGCGPGPVGPVDAGANDAGPDDPSRPPPLSPLPNDLIRRGTAEAATADDPVAVDGDIPAPPDGVVLVDLGAVVVGADGNTGTFLVDVDERITGLTVVVLGQPDAVVLVTRADAPDGARVVDDGPVDQSEPALAAATTLSRGFPAQYLSAGRVLPARRVGAFPVPSTADVRLSPGTWTFRVGHFTAATDVAQRPTPRPLARPVHVWVLARTAPAEPGRVGLALHFSGAGGLTAATAATSPVFDDALAVTRAVFADAGIDVDDVIYADLEDGAALRTIVLDAPLCQGGDLDEVVARGRPDRLNIFFVDRFECGSVGPFLLGLSPGIPGVPWTSSTPSSGVVVAATWLSTDPDRFAVTVAHEIGHWLGLFHTQENDRLGTELYDNVADTGEAAAARDNLMFFDVSRIDERALSAGQAATLWRGAVVQP